MSFSEDEILREVAEGYSKPNKQTPVIKKEKQPIPEKKKVEISPKVKHSAFDLGLESLLASLDNLNVSGDVQRITVSSELLYRLEIVCFIIRKETGKYYSLRKYIDLLIMRHLEELGPEFSDLEKKMLSANKNSKK